jgi:hypothetical protein
VCACAFLVGAQQEIGLPYVNTITVCTHVFTFGCALCTCTYVCMFACVHTYVCLHAYIRMYVCMRAFMCVCMYACIYGCMWLSGSLAQRELNPKS